MAMAAPSLAQTQSPSQVPPGKTLEQRPPTGSFSFPAAQGLTAPDGAEAIRLILRDLRVDGCPMPPDLSAIKCSNTASMVVSSILFIPWSPRFVAIPWNTRMDSPC
jgi:hypothetical protein